MTLNRVTEAVAALSALHAPSLDDAGLIDTQRQLGELRRRIDAASATIAAEVAHRSRPELGYGGLAQRLGARTPQLLVQQTTGLSKREANVLVRIGSLLSEHAPEENAKPWLADVLAAVGTGDLSVESAEVIRVSMGSPDDNVTAAELSAAAAQLVHEASSLTLERLAARGRELRADLDLAGVLGREQALRDRRYLHVIPQSDGMTRISGLLDPESAAIIVASLDAATSPRRGGPRFVDPDAKARGEEVVADARSTEQLALDSFVELVRIGTLADPGTVLGARQPAVQVLVTLRDLDARRGIGRIEGRMRPSASNPSTGTCVRSARCRSCSTRTVTSSTWVEINDCLPSDNEWLSPRGMADASSRGVTGPPPGRRRTTSTSFAMEVEPI
jgi:hypothetical protein